MISFGKRLLALFFATLLFAIYYMFLGIIDDPALDSSTVETMFVFSFIYGGCGIFTYGLAVSYVTDRLLHSVQNPWKHGIALLCYSLFGWMADRWILQIDTTHWIGYFSTTAALFVFVCVKLFEFQENRKS
ncbi:hypothetical protein H1R82_13835 [Thermoactinomyces intermedius]|jgi:hypothetical protein|uniref:Uncharacterized protein n=2 Tax=Thermoactinomyces TaxID=2023 RepID=A0A8I1AB56_THEIN|nr:MULTISPECIES: hypothetical protein [Thermoactinomyces]KFZ41243.1 hypothetical protein JS81_02460 [Thermoactinomyces sp. Gus2-1]MBA4548744.1 hypothetical protein [Thermoactinomyces intermedius]MBA4837702.1 hypothetical protein [Thermoactinomyces intermedius]MBH8594622.1 hypothetical protein [Thermoactinomyces intermedius]MBH8602131.1 hypothetical protein [Thermoactinomyces sp. CICC 23799]